MRHGPGLLLAALSLTPGLAWGQGNPLGPEFRVNTYTTGSQAGPLQSLERPSLSFDSFGTFVAVWSSPQDGSSYGTFGQRYGDSGAPLGPEFRVNAYTTGSQSLPDVAADPSGNFVVVWASDSQDGSSQGVFGQRYLSSGVPVGPEFRVNTSTTGHQGHPSVAADATGGFVVAWHSYVQVGVDSAILGQRFASSGSPLGAEFQVNTAVSFAHRFPSIASDAAANFVVVWGNMPPGGTSQVLGQRYAATGAPLGPEFRVNTATTLYQYFPAVASDTSGNFVVVWSASGGFFGGGPIDIRGRRYAGTGAPLGTEFRVSTTTGPDYFFAVPSVAADMTGNFVVTWDNYEDGSLSVFGQRYENTGAPLGPGFRVNTYTTADQDHPDVASDPAGRFVVVWRSDGPDGSALGVFGQRYSMIVPVELIRFGVE